MDAQRFLPTHSLALAGSEGSGITVADFARVAKGAGAAIVIAASAT